MNFSPLIIISSPSGTGKTSLCKMLVERDPNIKLSISATTRKPRPSEIDGQHYFFIAPEKFQNMIAGNQFLEYALVFDNYYGTPKEAVEEQLNQNHRVLFDIDWQGARQLTGQFDSSKVISFFLLPPSMEELHKRLQTRAEDSEEVVLKRMNKACDEMSHFDEYDYVLINHDLEATYRQVYNHINSKKELQDNRREIAAFVNNLLKFKTT